ncbi:hypothetical protein JYJ95_09555 [Corallococcus exiguus]|uniref:hypothetical protein n=1 Tax=Corallococcus exiguus TaxID=83462 RepID=UPI001A8FDC67|nr:hypothetical protein [Corallococcus exiguus]MBN8466761.1 hypothetical protein [Corallococcus exiguus]
MMGWQQRRLSERAQRLLRAASVHPVPNDEGTVRSWLLANEPDLEPSVFVDFQRDFGGLILDIPGEVLSLGLWYEGWSGGVIGPVSNEDDDGNTLVSCGSFRAAQYALYMRGDGAIYLGEWPAASSVEKYLEDMAMFSAAYGERPSSVNEFDLPQRFGERFAALGLSSVEMASDWPYFAWWIGDGVFVREDGDVGGAGQVTARVFGRADSPRVAAIEAALLGSS